MPGKGKRGYSDVLTRDEHPILASTKKKKKKKARRAFPSGSAWVYGNELKFFDTGVTDLVIDGGVNMTDSIVKIPQGTGQSQRIGRRATLKSMWWRFQYHLPSWSASTPTEGDNFRIVVYLDRQANGATATQADLFGTQTEIRGMWNLANKDRFEILWDKIWNLNYSTAVYVPAKSQIHMGGKFWNETFFKKLDVPLEFDGVNGAMTEIKSNNIGVALVGVNGRAGFRSSIRFRFSEE